MDASASTKPDATKTNVFNFYLNIDDISYSHPSKQKSSVIKYTKLPDFDFDSKATWGPNSYTLKPRLRRIISLDEDQILRTSRSMKVDQAAPPKMMTTSQAHTKRKFVTISEDEEIVDQHPKISEDKKPFTVKTTNKSSGADFKPKPTNNRLTSKLPNSTKFSREINLSAKKSASKKKEMVVNVAHHPKRGRQPNPTPDNSKIKNHKEPVRSSRTLKPLLKTSEQNKPLSISSDSDKDLIKIKSILSENAKSTVVNKRPSAESSHRLPQLQNKTPKVTFKDLSSKSKPLTVIHVPLDAKNKKRDKIVSAEPEVETVLTTTDHVSDTDDEEHYKYDEKHYKDAVVVTDPLPPPVSYVTDMRDCEVNTIIRTTCESTSQTDSKRTVFDSLEIPNVTLTKDKSEPKEAPTTFRTTSLPNLKVPPVTIVPQNEEVNSSDISFCQGTSYILSRATVTYTTRQKFNFQLVGSDDNVGPSQPSSPLDYPMNVVSVYKNGLKQKKSDRNVSSDDTSKKKNTPREDYLNHLNDMKTLNCSYVFNKLMKPSDIISTIRVNNGLLHNDYICEQFQRELNFIDSFFESLQYLETCSLTEKCYSESKIENLTNNSVLFDSTFDAKNSEYDNFLSKLENGANIDDTETMASKSLCLLNLLIRDEQRRAKNLLFVLKMREDALKDFTKSQILWLEKKKKHDNTDISTLKKKQRGALLKLQHECGEMQRMRKALVTLSEKRKVALMKTKKNIELKLKNNVDVEQIILGKKKLKRNSFLDRNATPLKCFDLSSSGCEESSTSKATSEASPLQSVAGAGVGTTSVTSVTSAEKCVQTSDHNSVDHATDTAAEHFVVVDGGYLNILFHNLSLPQIFSSGKQYEVNEEALRNIVNSANSHNTNLSGSEVVEKLMDQIKNKDVERSDRSCSSPSTARSLIEEFDQYYKDLHEDDKWHATTLDLECDNSGKVCEIKDSSVQTGEVEYEQPEAHASQTSIATSVTMTGDGVSRDIGSSLDVGEACACEAAAPSMVEGEASVDKEPVPTSQAPTGPLPVPVGAAAVVDSPPPDVPAWLPSKSYSSSTGTDSVSSQSLCASVSSIASLTAPVHVEAEELRRQQLAIEREIKALEQQQCRLLVVREIPDKPPPPYTPPTETRTPKPPRMFTPDDNLQEKVEKHITCPEGTTDESAEPFSVFVHDYCQESLERHKQEQSDMPWDACNLLPQKPPVEVQELVEKTSAELKDVLTTVTPAAVSGVSSRRSDHIDDILFAEWRRCEPEWTALHTDEAIVKNQIFESIFQKILNNTIDEYKKTVQCDVVNPD
ncbi:hypothetical protein PYW08_000313 [Mythimna loreyi]|uniref:Uncharacterized protein n=1 Tax=Mythimna loreyi TaxID=667449 RepID=A0ACC2RC43_9NEOP|nr:hypothetical protein PYW08_000313 [Mythimna loreyi]